MAERKLFVDMDLPEPTAFDCLDWADLAKRAELLGGNVMEHYHTDPMSILENNRHIWTYNIQEQAGVRYPNTDNHIGELLSRLVLAIHYFPVEKSYYTLSSNTEIVLRTPTITQEMYTGLYQRMYSDVLSTNALLKSMLGGVAYNLLQLLRLDDNILAQKETPYYKHFLARNIVDAYLRMTAVHYSGGASEHIFEIDKSNDFALNALADLVKQAAGICDRLEKGSNIYQSFKGEQYIPPYLNGVLPSPSDNNAVIVSQELTNQILRSFELKIGRDYFFDIVVQLPNQKENTGQPLWLDQFPNYVIAYAMDWVNVANDNREKGAGDLWLLLDKSYSVVKQNRLLADSLLGLMPVFYQMVKEIPNFAATGLYAYHDINRRVLLSAMGVGQSAPRLPLFFNLRDGSLERNMDFAVQHGVKRSLTHSMVDTFKMHADFINAYLELEKGFVEKGQKHAIVSFFNGKEQAYTLTPNFNNPSKSDSIFFKDFIADKGHDASVSFMDNLINSHRYFINTNELGIPLI